VNQTLTDVLGRMSDWFSPNYFTGLTVTYFGAAVFKKVFD